MMKVFLRQAGGKRKVGPLRRCMRLRGGWLFRDCSGAVLMEYVMLGSMVLLTAWFIAGDALFDPEGAVTGDFGLFGNAFMDWYYRIVDVVSLPVP